MSDDPNKANPDLTAEARAAARAVSGAMTDREVSLFLIGCSLGELLKACADLRTQAVRTVPSVVGDVEALESSVRATVELVRRALNPFDREATAQAEETVQPVPAPGPARLARRFKR